MRRALVVLWVGLLPFAPAEAAAQGGVARCLQLIAVYERHVAKNAAHPLPSISVEISVAIEQCREGKLDGAVAKLETALRGKGFRP